MVARTAAVPKVSVKHDPKLKTKPKPRGRRDGAKPASLHGKVAESIGKQILKGIYAPGAVLPNEADWCRIYGASRTTVREAVKTLNAKGLLTSRTKVGSRVEPSEKWNMLDRDVLAWQMAALPPDAYLRAVQQVRKMLEPEVAALAAANRSAEQLNEIRVAFEDMRKAGHSRASIEPDVRFHLALLAGANNFLLTPFGIMIESALKNMFSYTTRYNSRPKYFLPRHEAILRAVERGDTRAARKAMTLLLDDTDLTLTGSMPARGRQRPRGG
jgi:DNA-binding FadR family transcriptional regulator